MKKMIALCIVTILFVCLITGCGKTADNEMQAPEGEPPKIEMGTTPEGREKKSAALADQTKTDRKNTNAESANLSTGQTSITGQVTSVVGNEVTLVLSGQKELSESFASSGTSADSDVPSIYGKNLDSQTKTYLIPVGLSLSGMANSQRNQDFSSITTGMKLQIVLETIDQAESVVSVRIMQN